MLARAFFFAVLIFFFSENHSCSQGPAEAAHIKEDLELAQTDSGRVGETYKLTALGQLFEEKGDLKKALAYFKQALALCDSNHFMPEKAVVLKSMSEIYRKQNSFKLAYIYYKESNEINDSIEQALQQEKFAELNARMDMEKKEREILLFTKDHALQEAEAEKQKQLKNFFIAGGIILLLITGLPVNWYNLKRQSAKKLEEKNKIISEEKDRAESLRIRAEHGEKLLQQLLARMSHEKQTDEQKKKHDADIDVLKSGKADSGIEQKAQAGSLPGRYINLAYLREYTRGENRKMMKCLMMFKEGIPGKLGLVEDAYRKKDWSMMASVIHSMKPLVASVGMMKCEEEITACETIISTNQLNKLLPKIISIKKICKAAVEEVAEELGTMED